MSKKHSGLDTSAVLHAGYMRFSKYELLYALNTHFSDVCFPGDRIIYAELQKMFNRRSYFPPRNRYTVYIEDVVKEWLAAGEMRPDPHWWVHKVTHYH